MDKPKPGDIKTVFNGSVGPYLVEGHKIYSQGKWIDFNFTGSEIKQILSEVKEGVVLCVK